MKILFITSVVPYPPNRGDKLRIFNIIKNLSVSNETTIVTLVKNDEEKHNAEQLIELGYNVKTVEHSRKKGFINLIRTLWTFEPFQVSFHYSKKLFALIAEETTKHKYDVAYCHLFTTAQFHKAVKSKKTIKVYDITDATSVYLKRYIEFIKNPLRKFYFLVERYLIIRYERISKHFDVNYVCAPTDLNYFRTKKLEANFKLFTNGFDVEKYQADDTVPQKHRIVFAGSLPYFPNKDAALFFAKEVFPIIKQNYLHAKFYIVGANPPDEIKELASKDIIVTGFVEDIKKEYLISEVNVAPIRFGAGIQNKILEALALGVPTVATSITLPSFDASIRKFILSADTAEQIAFAVMRVFEDDQIRKIKMKECAELVKEKMSWNKIVSEEEKYLFHLVEGKLK